MNPEDEQRRGARAQQVLGHEIYVEAYEAIRARLVSMLESADLPADKRQRLNDLLVAQSQHRRYMEQIMVGGKMAAEQIERDRTFAERVKDKIRSAA
jgi:hypothetical protein